MELVKILAELDNTNDAHWTSDGQARTDVVSELAGEKVTRDDIRKAAPKFCRTNTVLTEEEATGEAPKGNVVNHNPFAATPNAPAAPKAKDPVNDIKPMLTQQPEEKVVVDLPDQEALEKEIAALEVERAELAGALDKARKAYELKVKEIDVLVRKRDGLTPEQQRVKQSSMIQQFIQSQIKQRQGKS